MSICVFRVRWISRRQSRTLIAAAAYRSASRLYDARKGREVDFTGKEDVVYSALLTPLGAERFATDRAAFWNAVDRREGRPNARLALDVVAALPPALETPDLTEVARGFAEEAFVRHGLGADLNIHDPIKTDGRRNPHAHIMATTRTILTGADAADLAEALDRKFKVSIRHLYSWRATLADHANARLAERGFDRRIDPASFRRQGLQLEPRFRLAISSQTRLEAGQATPQTEKLLDLVGRNGERIIAEPLAALRALSREQTVFTEEDLTRFLSRHAEDAGQLALAKARVLGDRALIDLGRDPAGVRWYASGEEVAREAGAVATGLALMRAGALLVFEETEATAALARTQALPPSRPAALLIPSPDRRREVAAATSAKVLGVSEALNALEEGALLGAVLVIMDAERLRTEALEPFLTAANRGDLQLHLVGGKGVRAQEGATGAALRALIERRDEGLAPPETETPERRFARLRGLSGGAEELDAGLGRRRRREGEAALERRRAILSARRSRAADGVARPAEGRGGPDQRLQILGLAPERAQEGPEL